MEQELYNLTRKEQEIQEYVRIIATLFAFLFIGTLLIIAIVNDIKIKELESTLTVPYKFEERLSVEETFWQYIMSMEVDEYLLVDTFTQVDEEEVEEYLPYDQSDVELLAQLMYAEEGIFFRNYEENPEEVERVHKLAGSVVLHRLENSYLGSNTIREVIFKEGQYAKQTLERVEQGQDIPEVVYTWAEELLTDGALGPKGLIYQAEFTQGEEYEKIGNQIFGIDPKYND